MKIVTDVLLILSLTVWVIGLMGQGAVGGNLAALVLVALVVLIALGRASGMSLVSTTLRIVVPIAALGVFVAWQGGGDARAIMQLLTSILGLMLALLGFYVLIYGFFRREDKKRD